MLYSLIVDGFDEMFFDFGSCFDEEYFLGVAVFRR
jgi:hypothetical protein